MRWRFLPWLVLVAACGERAVPLTVANPVHPLAAEVSVGGRPPLAIVGSAAEIAWRAGEEIRIFYEAGCGRESFVHSPPGCTGACGGGPPALEVTVDNREGEPITVTLGAWTVPVPARSTARARVVAPSCEAGARIAVGGTTIGTLPLRDSLAPGVTPALLDPSGARCYRQRSPAVPEGDALAGRSFYVLARADDFFPEAADPSRWTVTDEPCLFASPGSSPGARAERPKGARSGPGPRTGKDPVGDTVEALSSQVNACVLTAAKGKAASVRIAAKVVVNLRGQLLEADVSVSPASPLADEVRGCVTRLLKGTKYPLNDVPVTTVVKNWRVQIAF